MKKIDKIVHRLDIKKDKLREKFKHSEDFETFEAVFDTRTLMTIYSLSNDKYIEVLNGVIATGKEANVYWGVDHNGNDIAVKIYRTSTADFKSMKMYIDGDPRFKSYKKQTYAIITLWAQKEYKNLSLAHGCGVKVPRPIVVRDNVLIMEFIGENGIPAPLLKNVKIKKPRFLFDKVILYMSKLYNKARLIHADLSEYNIMYWNYEPFFIDISQGVLLHHPNALYFLIRDIRNILRFFSKYIKIPSVEQVFKKITGLNPDEYTIIFENP